MKFPPNMDLLVVTAAQLLPSTSRSTDRQQLEQPNSRRHVLAHVLSKLQQVNHEPRATGVGEVIGIIRTRTSATVSSVQQHIDLDPSNLNLARKIGMHCGTE